MLVSAYSMDAALMLPAVVLCVQELLWGKLRFPLHPGAFPWLKQREAGKSLEVSDARVAGTTRNAASTIPD